MVLNVFMQQVHGNHVVRVFKSDSGKIIENCDGLITNDSTITLVVKTADCLPISIVDSENKAIGLVHAGWRGLQKEIIKNAINLMVKEFGSIPSNLKIEIGPHICKKHYEVKSDVSKFFDGQKYLDLGKTAINQLVDLKINPQNIEVDKRCTFENLDLPSYRRDKTIYRLQTYLTVG